MEDRFTMLLVNAQHVKAVPIRNQTWDCQWALEQPLEATLERPSPTNRRLCVDDALDE